METMTRILAKEFQQNYINRQKSKKVLNIVFLKSQYWGHAKKVETHESNYKSCPNKFWMDMSLKSFKIAKDEKFMKVCLHYS